MPHKNKYRDYWKKNLQYLSVLLAIWFTVSYGFGILLVEQLDTLGMLLSFGIALLVSRFTPRPPPTVVEMVDRIRIPSGAGKAHEISV